MRPSVIRSRRTRRINSTNASLIETVTLTGVNLHARLADMLTKLANHWPASRADEFMPRGLRHSYRHELWALSITHISRPDVDTDLDVGQSGQPAPHDDVAGLWIAGSGEITAEARELGQVVR